MSFRQWIISRKVDEAWMVGTLVKLTDPKLFDEVLDMFYKERLRISDEDMK